MSTNPDKGTVRHSKIAKKMTICEMHRQLYKRLKGTDAYTPDVDLLLHMAFDAGKKLATKLTEHAVKWEDYKVVMEKLSKTKLSQDEEIAWDDPRDSNK
jgi:predicted protein tyrosine phosphatase